MIAARQIAFGKAAGAKKPYDAEIEYIESTGTQWIDTGVIPSSTCKFVDDCWRVKSTQFGSLNSGILRFHAYIPFCVGVDYLDRKTSYPYGSRTVVTLDNKHGVFNFNSTSIEFTPQQEPGAPTFVLFARNFAGTIDNYDKNCKMYGFKWWNDADEDITLDLIPVRKGNVGYMYDRVSGQLFGNQGTGEFVLGADI